MSEERPQGLSTGELVTRLSEQTSRLVRDELRLAQAEMSQKAKHGGIGAGLFGAGGLLALFGLGTLIAAAVLALALVLPAWAAALIVAAVLFVAAGVAALVGKKEIQQATPTPERTVETVKDDIDEIKEAMHHDK
ncbi:phage holin family protein [Aeromicrobium sp. PE09-221]|uniref:phage holin family protein n=1 Tax=Aeromicrobium sp. PE09-221 TaxID=1898043 RepID=UPI00191C781E|nr:phage holin family protein [Aeromicrobium sp. PE09-221]